MLIVRIFSQKLLASVVDGTEDPVASTELVVPSALRKEELEQNADVFYELLRHGEMELVFDVELWSAESRDQSNVSKLPPSTSQ